MALGLDCAHYFAERGTRRYGSEVDVSLSYALLRSLTFEVDYATYQSNGFAQSERKLWAAVEYRLGPPGGG